VTNGLLLQNVNPGDNIYHSINVSIGADTEPTEVVVGLYGHDMGLDGARIPVEVNDDIRPFSAVDFLKVTPERAIINPDEPVTFVIEGRVPEDVGSGGRYAIVNITTTPIKLPNSDIAIVLEQMVPIILTISGTDLEETGEITKIDFSNESILVTFKNTGNHHFKSSAEAIIKNENGDIVATASAPVTFNSLIPPASWLFQMPIDDDDDDDVHLAPGMYTIEAKVTKEDGSLLDSREAEVEVQL